MTTHHDELRPEEFAQAATEAIADALARDAGEAPRVLAEAGLFGVCAAEDDGGLGLPLEFALPVVNAAGRLQLRLPLPEQILLASALRGTPQAEALAAGEKLATIAWQGSVQQGTAAHARHVAQCDWVLVDDGGGAVLLEVSSLSVQKDGALDPDAPQSWLDLRGATVVARIDAPARAALVHASALLMAELANGAAEAALELTAGYMATRVQFGRPLSAKQAVRHLLARMKLLQEASSAAVRRALRSNEFGEARGARPALAGAIANSAFILEKAIHLHGGMGFTWEVPLHYSLREIRKLDAAFGAGALPRGIGQDFIRSV
ncbi:acyl-CoA dehydrogenase family protein [Cupriavidus sp. AU9028]|uniref:acyl-CoA dehydrogenase family protein n=1 Tax=Cupriavidus sp. AU9028 TaxID=2871157 RepID=UPI001C946286|nr:acyl-CoA dehydrogenase family protein [Cupriavidus sp. AU9028]MBY4895536.1 acyl-CoA/acyl-ACP dehydrogenase [Cupriavidus sp. AU9028]